MGAAIASSLSLALSYCVCTATNSLCHACLGAPTGSGRKRSVLLLTIAIAFALWFQYHVAPAIMDKSGWMGRLLGQVAYSQWHSACDQYTNDAVVQVCAANAGVFRPLFLAAEFFFIMAIASKAQPQLNREAWPAKLMLFCFLVLVSVFLPTAPLFSGLFLWLARIGAMFFILFQQVILIDVAYNWNEDWVDRADQSDRYQYGSGVQWLRAIIGTTVSFYILCLVGMVLLYRTFGSCASNIWIITLTLLAVLGVSGVSAMAEQGSLLTSSILSLYITYLGYSMVSKNPVTECNPMLGGDDVTGMVIGMTLTAISLAWTGWSWTAEERLEGTSSGSSTKRRAAVDVDLDVPFLDPDDAPTSGVVMEGGSGEAIGGDTEELQGIWKLNIVMALISCWVAMTLTAWGSLEGDPAGIANPTAGRFNMAMIGLSQWCAVLLYVWTLVAPELFPDRDFS